jgi:hypothetical protein
VEGIWKCLEMQAREALKCCKQSLKGECGRSSEDQNAIKTQIVKAQFLRFQMGRRTLLEIGLEAIHLTSWLRSCLHFAHV